MAPWHGLAGTIHRIRKTPGAAAGHRQLHGGRSGAGHSCPSRNAFTERNGTRMNRLPFMDRLVVPAIAAPMLRVSGIELVSAACAAGVIGAFPTANCTSLDEFAAWLERLRGEAEEQTGRAPHCPDLIQRLAPAPLKAKGDLIVRPGAKLLIASVGSPASVIPTLHDGGCL